MQKAEKWESMFGPNHFYNGWDVFFFAASLQHTSATLQKGVAKQNQETATLK